METEEVSERKVRREPTRLGPIPGPCEDERTRWADAERRHMDPAPKPINWCEEKQKIADNSRTFDLVLKMALLCAMIILGILNQ